MADSGVSALFFARRFGVHAAAAVRHLQAGGYLQDDDDDDDDDSLRAEQDINTFYTLLTSPKAAGEFIFYGDKQSGWPLNVHVC